MELKKSIFAVLLLLVSTIAIGQNIITITEKDRDGKYLNKDGSIKEGYKNNKIVDINSVLAIDLNRDEIIKNIGKTYKTELPKRIAEKLTALTVVIDKRNEILTEISKTVDSYDYTRFKSDTSAYKKYVSTLQVLTKKLTALLEIDKRISLLYVTKYGDDGIYEGVFNAATEFVQGLQKEIEEFAEENGVSFQFGGWVYKKDETIPIHLSGFDDIKPQKPFEVDRWQFLPTDEQVKELQNIQNLAKENKDNNLNILKLTAENQLEAIKSFGCLELIKLLNDLKKEIEKVKSSVGSLLDPTLLNVINEIVMLEAEINSFKTNLDIRMNYYTNVLSIKEIQLTDFLTHAKNDINFITVEDGKKVFDNVEQVGKDLQNLKLSVINTSGNIKSLFEKLKSDYTLSFNSIKASVENGVEKILMGEKIDIAALKFGVEVYKLTLTDIPMSTELDLINTGVRSDGDRVVFKLSIASKGINSNPILDSKEIYMFKVLPHVETTIGVIFAHPWDKTNISTQFQMAPCYNVLFKGFFDQKARRRSVVYNHIFGYSFGLHVSSPDFNKDDVPEIGVGVVISLLNDYVQSGVAYNVFEGKPYWFFGLRLPISTFNLGASGQVNSKSADQ
jgi:hypothetical protein